MSFDGRVQRFFPGEGNLDRPASAQGCYDGHRLYADFELASKGTSHGRTDDSHLVARKIQNLHQLFPGFEGSLGGYVKDHSTVIGHPGQGYHRLQISMVHPLSFEMPLYQMGCRLQGRIHITHGIH